MDKDIQSMRLCTECIGDEGFSSYIEEGGEKGKCDFSVQHGDQNQTLSVKDFSAHVDDYFQEKYCWGTVDRFSGEANGDGYDVIIYNDLDIVENNVLNAIVKTLAENEDCYIPDGDEPFYDDSRGYENIEDVREYQRQEEAEFEDYWYNNRVAFKWQDFCQSVVYGARFFNIKDQLDSIFGKADGYSDDKRRPVYIISKGKAIYRARKLGRELTAEIVKGSPSKELGAPSPERSVAGRMNVQHIPAFYAAFCPDVALRELQPYISEGVAVGKFVLQRDIKVFDFTVFDRMYDEKYGAKGVERSYDDTRYEVVTLMQEEISKPVSSDSKSLSYIPTQVLTEYIQEHFDVDAIIFFSSLFSEARTGEKRNIVLLNKKFDSGNFAEALSIDKEGVSIKSVKSIEYEVEDKVNIDDLSVF